MVNLSGSDDYDDFIRRYFSTSIPSQICRAKPASRIPIIPLILFPHAWSILDSNISLYSTTVEPQLSCLGLYRRYDYLRTRGQGEWFTLITEEAKVLGISSAVYKGDNRYQVDGFCHPDHDFFIRLMQTAVNWCKAKKAVEITFNVSKQDKNKENLVRDVGFRTMEEEAYLKSGNRRTRTLLYSTV